MRRILAISIAITSICQILPQEDEKAIYYRAEKIPQRKLDKEKLMSLLQRGIEIMASEECEEDRKKILEFDDEKAISFATFSPMATALFGKGFNFTSTDNMYNFLQQIRRTAGLKIGPHIGFAPNLLAKVVVNSVRLTDETIMLMVDKARRDDKTYDSALYIISEPTELKERPLLNLNRKELIPLLRRGIEIMAREEYKEDRKKILEITDKCEYDELEYVWRFSKFASNGENGKLIREIQKLEDFTGINAASMLFYDVVLNSFRLQEYTILLIVYYERLVDRLFPLPPPPPPPTKLRG